VFTDEAKAQELVTAAELVDEFRMTVNDREYYVGWVGYFEHLEGVHIETLVVQ
jgi:hypothetical protein